MKIRFRILVVNLRVNSSILIRIERIRWYKDSSSEYFHNRCLTRDPWTQESSSTLTRGNWPRLRQIPDEIMDQIIRYPWRRPSKSSKSKIIVKISLLNRKSDLLEKVFILDGSTSAVVICREVTCWIQLQLDWWSCKSLTSHHERVVSRRYEQVQRVYYVTLHLKMKINLRRSKSLLTINLMYPISVSSVRQFQCKSCNSSKKSNLIPTVAGDSAYSNISSLTRVMCVLQLLSVTELIQRRDQRSNFYSKIVSNLTYDGQVRTFRRRHRNDCYSERAQRRPDPRRANDLTPSPTTLSWSIDPTPDKSSVLSYRVSIPWLSRDRRNAENDRRTDKWFLDSGVSLIFGARFVRNCREMSSISGSDLPFYRPFFFSHEN